MDPSKKEQLEQLRDAGDCEAAVVLLREEERQGAEVDALQRGMKMMHIAMKLLPPEALAYAKHLCKQYGGCAEILLTAWCHYAECVEGLKPSPDEAYVADDTAKRFFKEWREK